MLFRKLSVNIGQKSGAVTSNVSIYESVIFQRSGEDPRKYGWEHILLFFSNSIIFQHEKCTLSNKKISKKRKKNSNK